MQIKQLTYWGSKQYELLTVISLSLVSLTVGFILTTLIQNETTKLSRTNFLQDVTQSIRSGTGKLVRTNLIKDVTQGIQIGTDKLARTGTNLSKDIITGTDKLARTGTNLSKDIRSGTDQLTRTNFIKDVTQKIGMKI